MMMVAGASLETRQRLREIAQERYGCVNASVVVRALIAETMAQVQEPTMLPMTVDEASDTVRVELRLPRVALTQLTERAEKSLSPRNYYIASILLAALGQPQLSGDQIEALRRSNYELSKIGTNLNQIAHAANIIVKGGGGEMPEISEKLLSLRQVVKQHTDMVLRALEAGTVAWETTKRGRGQAPRRSKRRTS
jgi:hypothetical protein